MPLRNLSIRAKLIGAFTVLILLLIGLGALSQKGLQQINARLSEIADYWLIGVREVGALNGDVMTYRAAVLRQMLSTGLETKKIDQEIADAAKRVDEALKRYEQTLSLDEDRKQFEGFRHLWGAFVQEAGITNKFARDGNWETGYEHYREKVEPIARQIDQSLRDLVQWNSDHADAARPPARVPPRPTNPPSS